jgi:hypothetical protein
MAEIIFSLNLKYAQELQRSHQVTFLEMRLTNVTQTNRRLKLRIMQSIEFESGLASVNFLQQASRSFTAFAELAVMAYGN